MNEPTILVVGDEPSISEVVTSFLTARSPTVCVTRAGAGGGTPSDWKKAEA